ncbi:MAG: hypothetical protein M3Q09_01500, partial [Gemmatimonadota bacterium]|nr:hypothetical protein [Gemmatimonadota bacterium]
MRRMRFVPDTEHFILDAVFHLASTLNIAGRTVPADTCEGEAREQPLDSPIDGRIVLARHMPREA